MSKDTCYNSYKLARLWIDEDTSLVFQIMGETGL